jgi:hypothetical protein
MSELNDCTAADEHAEQIGRREAITRFAKYTAPVMLAVLVSTHGTPAVAISGRSGPAG